MPPYRAQSPTPEPCKSQRYRSSSSSLTNVMLLKTKMAITNNPGEHALPCHAEPCSWSMPLTKYRFPKKGCCCWFCYEAIICNILLLIIVISLFLPSPASDGKIVLILYRLPTKEPKDYETYPQAVVALSRRLRNRSHFILHRSIFIQSQGPVLNVTPPKMTNY